MVIGKVATRNFRAWTASCKAFGKRRNTVAKFRSDALGCNKSGKAEQEQPEEG